MNFNGRHLNGNYSTQTQTQVTNGIQSVAMHNDHIRRQKNNMTSSPH